MATDRRTDRRAAWQRALDSPKVGVHIPLIPNNHESAEFGALATKPHNEELFRVFDALNEDAWIDCNQTAAVKIER